MIDTRKLMELADSYAKARMDYTDSEPDGWASERDELFKELDRVTAERDALKVDAEMLDVLRQSLIWDGNGYWLPDLCIKEREWGQDYCKEPTKEEFDAAIRASKVKT